MRMIALPLVLALALSLSACKQSQTKKAATDPAQTKSAAASQSLDLQSTGDPAKDAERERFKAQKQIVVNSLNDVLEELQSQGIEIRKTPKKPAWRLIVPAYAQITDQAKREAEATKLASDFKAKIETIMQKKIQVEVYADDKETTRLNP
ncbi:hypothetical protein J7643_08940 [bacterium]|nr:hypothetical protein [bacterium]